MTTMAPKIEPLPPTSAQEWASETLSSVPTAHASNDTSASTLGSIQETLFNATVTAAQYLPPKVVEYIPGGAAIIAASDNGNLESQSSFSSDTIRDARGMSLPSKEVNGAVSSNGVGSLPGTASETAVAKLPLEKEIENNHTKSEPKEKETPGHDLAVMTKSYAEREWESMRNVSTTASKRFGSRARQEMAKFPLGKDGKDHKSYAELEWEAMINATKKPTSSSTSSSSGSILMKSLPQVPQDETTSTPSAEQKSPESPSAAPTRSPTRSSIFSRTKHAKKASSGSGSSSLNNSSGSPRKTQSKLLTKLRGEAKIISGKLSGKGEKVDEGRRIVKGEV